MTENPAELPSPEYGQGSFLGGLKLEPFWGACTSSLCNQTVLPAGRGCTLLSLWLHAGWEAEGAGSESPKRTVLWFLSLSGA